MMRAKAAWCTRCNAERPIVKAYPAQGARHRVNVCLVCRERVDTGRQWSAARPARDSTGKMRQSTSEARRGTHLITLQQAGLIADLRLCNDHPRETFALAVYGTQPVLDLVDTVFELLADPDGLTPAMRARLRARAQEVGRARHVICHYTPDFSYTDDRGVHHVEDVKGRVSREYPIKKRLMLASHGVTVEEPDMRREARHRKRERC